jgi:hypothetical protein
MRQGVGDFLLVGVTEPENPVAGAIEFVTPPDRSSGDHLSAHCPTPRSAVVFGDLLDSDAIGWGSARLVIGRNSGVQSAGGVALMVLD